LYNRAYKKTLDDDLIKIISDNKIFANRYFFYRHTVQIMFIPYTVSAGFCSKKLLQVFYLKHWRQIFTFLREFMVIF